MKGIMAKMSTLFFLVLTAGILASEPGRIPTCFVRLTAHRRYGLNLPAE